MSQQQQQEYVPPKVWEWKGSEGAFANINRPTAGAQTQGELPVGKHPLQLYSLGTPNGQKVTILLEELIEAGKLDNYDAWLIKIFEGDQFKSGFVDVNPNSKIPALVDRSAQGGPLRIFESGSILVYLAEKYGSFLPTEDVRAKFEVLNWLFWQMGSAPFVGGGFGHFFAYAPTKQEYPIDRYTLETKRQLDVLDKQLATHPYVAGSELSIADFAIWPWYGGLVLNRSYPRATEFLAAHEYTHVVEWAKRLDQRPGFKRGRIVNRLMGEPSEQLRERHDASDFETKTQDKVEAATAATTSSKA